MKTFQITVRGQKWSGSWELEGKEVRVDSAYGSTRAPVGRKDPTKVAEAALGELVTAWSNR
jgi:hypothetical protein